MWTAFATRVLFYYTFNNLNPHVPSRNMGDDYDILLLPKSDECESMRLFKSNKKVAQEVQSQIQQTEQEIDRMVDELYGLN